MAIEKATAASQKLLEGVGLVQRQLENNAEETNDLLDGAEKIIAGPLVYYFGHILADVFGAVVQNFVVISAMIPWPEPVATWLSQLDAIAQPEVADSVTTRVIAYLVALLLVVIGLRKLRNTRDQKREARIGTRPKTTASD